jgi:hypothetical protein
MLRSYLHNYNLRWKVPPTPLFGHNPTRFNTFVEAVKSGATDKKSEIGCHSWQQQQESASDNGKRSGLVSSAPPDH